MIALATEISYRPGWVYFAYAPESNRCKIGWTTRTPEARLGSLTDSCATVNLWGMLLADSQAMESDLHHHFRRLRLRGEWFLVDDELRDFVQNHTYATPEHLDFVSDWSDDNWREWDWIAADDNAQTLIKWCQANPVELVKKQNPQHYFLNAIKPWIISWFGWEAKFREDERFKTSLAYDLVYEMCYDLLPR